MLTSHPRKNIKIPAHEFAYVERAAEEDGEPSATAYIRGLIRADRIARSRRAAEAMLAEVYGRDRVQGSGERELIATTVRLFELLTDGERPTIPEGAHPHTAARVVLAQLAARIIVDGAEHEYRTGNDLALGAFITTLAADPRVTVENVGAAAGAIVNILSTLIDLLGERELINAATPGART